MSHVPHCLITCDLDVARRSIAQRKELHATHLPALVIFGASGDLAKRKLIPAMYEMAREKLLPEEVRAGRLRAHAR